MTDILATDVSLTFIDALFGFLFGAASGSFIGVVLYRVPKGMTLGGRSECVCGHQLTWYENIPVLSWLALRGKARCCSAPIPVLFLAEEVSVGLLCAAFGALFGPVAAVAVALLTVAMTIVVSRLTR